MKELWLSSMDNINEGLESLNIGNIDSESFSWVKNDLNIFLEHMPMGISIVSIEGNVVYTNRYLHSFYSSASGLYDKTLWELNLGFDETSFNAALLELKTGTEQISEKVRLTDKKYNEFEHRVNLFALPNNANQIVLVYQNISDKQIFEDRVNHASEAGDLGCWELDLETSQLWLSPHMARMMKMPEHGMSTQYQFIKAIKEEDGVEVTKTMDKAIENSSNFSTVFRLKEDVDNQPVYLKADGKIILNSQGKAIRAVGSAQDITERVTFESALVESKRLFKKFMDINPAEVFIKDKKGTYIYGNEAWAKQFDTPLSKLIGKNEKEIYSSSDLEEQKKYDQQLKKQGITNIEKKIKFGKRKTRFWSTFYFPISRIDGEELIGGFGIDITPIKKAEQNLRQKQNELDSILGALCTGVIKIDASLSIIYANPAACDILNLKTTKNGRFTFQTDWNFLDDSGEPVGATFLPIQEALFLGKSIPNLELGIRNEATTKWLSINMSPIKEKNDVRGVVINFIEITPRKEAFKKVAQSEKLLKSINTNIREGIFRKSEKQGLIYVNDAYLDIFGFKNLEEAQNYKVEDAYFDYDDRNQYMRELERKKNHQSEILFRKKDGSLFWASMSSTYNASTNDTYIDGAIRDINNEKLASQSILNNQRQLRSILDNSEDLIFLIDPVLKLTAFNINFSKYISKRYGAQPAVGQPLSKSFNNESNVWLTRVKKALSIKKNGYYIDDFEDKIYEVKIILTTELDAVNGVTVFIKDITSLKSQEKILEEQNATLHKVNEELDRFVYSASHDLRAPLTSLLGLIALGYRETDVSIIQQYMELMEKSVKKLDDFILDIINYSKNSRKEVEPERIDFDQLIEKIVDNLKYLNRNSYIEVKQNISLDKPFISDRTRINMIFNNLISNTFRYFDAEKKNSFVSIDIQPDERGGIAIVIEDNGIGIEEEHLSKVFEMFYRATDKKQGSGLGLYIVKEAIEALKGTVALESQKDIGTKFIIYLPHINQ